MGKGSPHSGGGSASRPKGRSGAAPGPATEPVPDEGEVGVDDRFVSQAVDALDHLFEKMAGAQQKMGLGSANAAARILARVSRDLA